MKLSVVVWSLLALGLCSTIMASHAFALGSQQDISVALDMDGGYRTCACRCEKLIIKGENQELCVRPNVCSEGSQCKCHMFDASSGPDQTQWKHIWSSVMSRPAPDKNHVCLSVKKK